MNIFMYFIIVFAIFISIFTIIDVLNIIRYYKIKKCNTNEYILRYKEKEKCTKDKVVLSLTTTPERINKIKPLLNSLFDQTVRVDQIALNIPKYCDKQSYNVPKDIADMCNIFNVGKDYGKGTCFIPTLLREKSSGVKIILLDDNMIYGKDMLEKLIKESDRQPDKCIYIGDDFKISKAILIKTDFVNKIVRDKCDNNWLDSNLNVGKVGIPYKSNYKYL